MSIAGVHHSADYWRAKAGEAYDRMFHPIGSAFPITAVSADGDRTGGLRSLRVPSLVIHGRMDPLITLSGGKGPELTAKTAILRPSPIC